MAIKSLSNSSKKRKGSRANAFLSIGWDLIEFQSFFSVVRFLISVTNHDIKIKFYHNFQRWSIKRWGIQNVKLTTLELLLLLLRRYLKIDPWISCKFVLVFSAFKSCWVTIVVVTSQLLCVMYSIRNSGAKCSLIQPH